MKTEEISLREVDFMIESDTILWYNNSTVRGVYTASDPELLLLRGALEDENK